VAEALTPPSEPPAPSDVDAPPPPRGGPNVQAPAAPPAPPAEPLLRLRAVLEGDDDVAKIDTIEGLAASEATGALPGLLAIDLAREPAAAPTVIHAVAALAKHVGSGERRAAVAVLARWLGEESSRHDPDAEGNVPNLVEALATIGGAEATAALVGALEKGQLDLSVETLAVQSLGHEGDLRALETVRRFVDKVAALPPEEGIRGELRAEAIAAGNSALSALQGG